MRLDIYQQETSRIARENQLLLRQAREILQTRPLSPLEEGGVLHALQVLIENAIGKAKQLLKQRNNAVPISAYDAFKQLSLEGLLPTSSLADWNAVVGLRNRIVHDYMNIDMNQLLPLVSEQKYDFVVDFLMQPINEKT
jgi:uncharacterized protein YutE (UPF0331/DUF86 family)